jgi:diaminopropionate ammonia-lyase
MESKVIVIKRTVLYSKMSPSYYHINKAANQLPDNATTAILNNSRAIDYHSALSFYQPTPLVELSSLAKHVSVGTIYLKDESHRFGLNAFKGLGASYAIFELLQKHPETATFCSATDGNHGRAVAWAAKRAGKASVIFVPKDTTPYRITAIENEGAKVIKTEGNYDETCLRAEMTSKNEGWQLVQDTAWEGYEEIPAYIMAGYLTHFKELENSVHTFPLPKIDIVFLQSGVGSWAAAAVWYYVTRYGKNCPKLVIVEPSESDGLLQSFKQGRRTTAAGNQQTIMAGLNCGIPSSTAWEIIKDNVDAAIKIEDSFAMQAMRILHSPADNDKQVIAGESGAAGLAGFIAIMTDERYAAVKEALGITEHSSILVYSTEGATDPEGYEKIVTAIP